VATPSPTPRSKAVALTFDDGPSTVNTPKVLKALKKYNAHATFFVVGSRVSEGAEILKQEVAQGCEIANHSWNHTNLAKLSMKKVNKQYDKTAKLVKKLVGYDVKLLRPPYGAISQKMRKKLKHPMILWNVDTLDWKLKNTKKILKQIKKNVKDGDIILMHDIHPTTAESLDTVLSWLVKNDYDILTVSELAERKGAPMHNGKAYGGFSG
jgi:peptidoglycan/xylan/chitin deacetylase (PgdA/CDA1 family)